MLKKKNGYDKIRDNKFYIVKSFQFDFNDK